MPRELELLLLHEHTFLINLCYTVLYICDLFHNPDLIIYKNEFRFAAKTIEMQLNFLQEYQLFTIQHQNIKSVTQPLFFYINQELYLKEINLPRIEYFKYDNIERSYRFISNYYDPTVTGMMSKFELYTEKKRYLIILEKIFSQLTESEKYILADLLKFNGPKSGITFKEMLELLNNYKIIIPTDEYIPMPLERRVFKTNSTRLHEAVAEIINILIEQQNNEKNNEKKNEKKDEKDDEEDDEIF